MESRKFEGLWYCCFEPFGATACPHRRLPGFSYLHHEGENREEKWKQSRRLGKMACVHQEEVEYLLSPAIASQFCLSVSPAPQTESFPTFRESRAIIASKNEMSYQKPGGNQLIRNGCSAVRHEEIDNIHGIDHTCGTAVRQTACKAPAAKQRTTELRWNIESQ